MNGNNNVTEVWKRYEAGRTYNQQLIPNQYDLVSANTEFYAGNQWLNMPETPAMARLPKPVFNIIKRVTTLFVASLTSSASTISFQALRSADKESDTAAAFATAEVTNLLEKFKMDYRIRDVLFDGAQSGDYCAHFFFDPNARPYNGVLGDERGEIKMELVDGINVMFGNPNLNDVESQPYILVIGRDTVGNLKAEAKQHGSEDWESITGDADTMYQTAQGGKTELMWNNDDNDKALYAYMYVKKSWTDLEKDENGNVTIDENGQMKLNDYSHVFVTKATQNCVIYEDIDTNLSVYPVAWGNWEKQKNQYHGRALVTGIIPNQIFINTMFAMVMRHLQLSGFPTTVYNASIIQKWSSEVGQKIAVRNLPPNQNLSTSAAYNLQTADMSNQIMVAIDKAMQYTKECLGATDAQMGNVKPDNTSAIMVLQNSAEVPLENVRAGLYEWLENVGTILLDMMGTYYGQRGVVVEREVLEPATDELGNVILDPMTGQIATKKVMQRTVENYDFSQFKNLWLDCRVDVGASTYFSEIATVQTLDNLRRDGIIDVVQYLERIPDKLIPRRQELIDALKDQLGAQQQMSQSQSTTKSGVAPAMGGDISVDKAVAQMTPTMQGKFQTLPTQAKNAALQSAKM